MTRDELIDKVAQTLGGAKLLRTSTTQQATAIVDDLWETVPPWMEQYGWFETTGPTKGALRGEWHDDVQPLYRVSGEHDRL